MRSTWAEDMQSWLSPWLELNLGQAMSIEEIALNGPRVIELIASRFALPTPLNQALIDRHEWRALLEDIHRTTSLGYHGEHITDHRTCDSCQLAIAIDKALRALA
jgi:hypothetical protein